LYGAIDCFVQFSSQKKSILNQKININFPKNISLYVKREDLLHPFVSGNKFRKLKYNLLQAKAENQQIVLTFGGAFSNPIAFAV
jgi:1-aminocyclopropane-1-carboxylate deaminase